MIGSLNMGKARQIADRVLSLSTAADVSEYLASVLEPVYAPPDLDSELV